MDARRYGHWLLRLLYVLLLPAGPVLGQQVGESVLVREPVDGDFYAAGREVGILASITGDAVVAGQAVRFEAPVDGDLIAAGESVTVGAPVADDVRVAGRRIVIDESVGDHMVAAGEMVLITGRARINGFLWAAGETIRLEGPLAGELRAAGRQVIIESEVSGDALILADRIVIGPRAHLRGNLIWRSNNPMQIDPASRVDGRIIRRPLPAAPVQATGSVAAVVALIAIASVLVAAVVLYLLFPNAADRAATGLRQRPTRGFAVGALLLLLSPLVIGLLFATSVGGLLALIALALYLAALPVGWLTGAYVTADLSLRAAGKRESSKTVRSLALILAVVVLALLQLIPFLGFLIGLTVLLAGLGALAFALRPVLRTEAMAS